MGERGGVNFQLRDHEIDAETQVVEVLGEADLYTAPELKERLLRLIEAGNKRLVVDLSEATFIDSTILGVLVGAIKRLQPAQGSVAIVSADEKTTALFEITGLDHLFTIHATREAALRPAARTSGG
jgi:anti-sigma B factor antagonist